MMYKLCVYVPVPALASLKEALFTAGAGQHEHYQRCCWQVLGVGQFQPEEGSQPHIGQLGMTATVAEYRVEMLVSEDKLKAVCLALHEAHPYEEPAYDVTHILRLSDFI